MKEFLWGSATASYQCEGAWNEGGKGPSIWDEFSHHSPNNINHVDGDVASDHYHRFLEDFKMMKEGNQNSYRFSISWPRILPDGIGEVNQEGIAYYHRMIDALLEQGIEPIITLYHWDMPLSLFQEGGWENRSTAEAFAEYANICFKEYGSKVKLWTTLNEPYYSTLCMYGSGNYPPNVKDTKRFMIAAYHQMYASALAAIKFRTFKNIGTLGIVADIHPCYGVDTSEACNRAVRLSDQVMNGWVLQPALKGSFPAELIEELSKRYDMSFIREEDQSIFQRGTLDFIGLNYYNRALIRPYSEGPSMVLANNRGVREIKNNGIKVTMAVKDMFEKIEDPSGVFTDWDFEIYPQGLYDAIMEVKEKYDNPPIYISENGIGLREERTGEVIEDEARIEFLKQHIDAMLKAMHSGADVRGYYVWSTFDLYSWINGYEKRYGLVYVDYEDNCKRYPKKSYYWYRDFIDEYRRKEKEDVNE